MRCSELEANLNEMKKRIFSYEKTGDRGLDHPHQEYLKNWFDTETMNHITFLFNATAETPDSIYRDFFQCCISNLLRDYSFQDPQDLRIRRRKSPLPIKPLIESFLEISQCYLRLKRAAPDAKKRSKTIALNDDIRTFSQNENLKFDAAITSPPYTTALPYVDTQRLSLVWFNMISPNDLKHLERRLIGARELTLSQRHQLVESLKANSAKIPKNLHRLCLRMQYSLTGNDGFRKQATPALIYRYFDDMLTTFINCKKLLKMNAPFGLIVGHNKTSLGGINYTLDTPNYLANLACHAGWQLEEILELETYRRYSIHKSNSGTRENLIILRR